MWIGIGISLLWLTTFVIGFKSSLALVTAAGFAASVIGLRYPLLGAVGISVICSVDALSRVFLMTSGYLRYNTFNYWLLLVIFISIPLMMRQKDPHTKILHVYIFVLFVGLVMTPGMKDGILNLLNLVSVFGLLVYFYRCRKYRQVWYVLGITVGTLSAVGGLAFFFNPDQLSFVEARAEYVEKDIIDRNYIDPNALCYCFLTGIFALCLAISSKTKKGKARLVLLMLFAINCCWVFLVGSRGGMLVSTACALFVLTSFKSRSKRVTFAAFAVIVVLAVVSAFPSLRDRSMGRIDKLFDEQYSAAQRTSSRSDFAIGAWRMFADNPMGIGTGGFKRGWAKLEHTDGLSKGKLGVEKAAHSAWLKTLAENGIPGILVFTAFVFSFAYVGYKYRARGAFPLGLLVSVTLTSAFTSTQFQSKGIWFIVAAAIVFLHHRPRFPKVIPDVRAGAASPPYLRPELTA